MVNKPKATRSAFPATFDGEEPPDAAPEAEDAGEATQEATAKKGRKKRAGRAEKRNKRQQRNRSRSPAAQDRPTDNRSDRKRWGPCQACGGMSRTFKRCYLVLGRERDWITEEARETFRNNMKVPTFKAEVNKTKAADRNNNE